MEEVWKDIEGYEGMYQVSNLGRVKSLERYYVSCRGLTQLLHEKILKQYIKKTGYVHIVLCKNGVHKTYLLHRIVASAFLPNPDNLPQINHKDENQLNNTVSNLEWCTSSYNINYGNRTQKAITTFKTNRNQS